MPSADHQLKDDSHRAKSVAPQSTIKALINPYFALINLKIQKAKFLTESVSFKITEYLVYLTLNVFAK